MSIDANPDSFASEQLRAFVERIERLLEERDGIMADVREVYAELKGCGFDKTVVGQVISARRKQARDAGAFAEQSEIFDLYWQALEASHTHTRARDAA